MPVPVDDASHQVEPDLKRSKIVDTRAIPHVIVCNRQVTSSEQSDIVLVVQVPSSELCCIRVTSNVCRSDVLSVDGILHQIVAHNGTGFDPLSTVLAHGDFVELQRLSSAVIHAGGHHGAQPMSLPAGADFGSRCEFAINSSGWLASDEMRYFVECIQWTNTSFAQFAPIVRWDLQMLDFDASSYHEIIIPNNRLTVIPILCGAHWAAVEVLKAGARTVVEVIGFPGPLVQNVIWAVARIMDLNPSHLTAHQVTLPPREHFCGWQLLARWISRANLIDIVPAVNDGYLQTSLDRRHLIDEVLVASIDDWHNAGIPTAEWTSAARLRREFFVHLANRGPPPTPVTTERLFVSFVDSDAPAPPRNQATLEHQAIIPDLIWFCADSFISVSIRHGCILMSLMRCLIHCALSM